MNIVTAISGPLTYQGHGDTINSITGVSFLTLKRILPNTVQGYNIWGKEIAASLDKFHKN